MEARNFRAMLEKKWGEGKFVCVGLDPDLKKIPECVKQRARDFGLPGHSSDPSAVVSFCLAIVKATKDLVCAFKPNSAFFEGLSAIEGMSALHEVIGRTHELAPDVPVILDVKRADIGNTNIGYAQSAFDLLQADAITVHPYLGREAMQPFLDRKDKGIIVLCRTSNPGAGEFQDLAVPNPVAKPFKVGDKGVDINPATIPLYLRVAYNVSHEWNVNGNCALVAGATFPEELGKIRAWVGDMPILIPGVGKQGGDVEKVVRAGMDSKCQGMIINNSSAVLYASSGEDFAEAARAEVVRLDWLVERYRN